jgi:hypothetical protein
MWRFRLPISRNQAGLIVFLFVVLFHPLDVFSQCSAGFAPTTLVYTTQFTSTDGNDNFVYNFPQFPAATGTLYAVAIRSTITVNSDMNIHNNNTTGSISASARIYRTDDFSTDAPSSDYSIPNLGSTFSAPGLAAGTTQSFPATRSINHQSIVDTIYTGDPTGDNPNSFVGNSTVNLFYSTGTSVLPNPNNGTVSAYTSVLLDTMSISITYYYCYNILPIDLLTFTATRENDQDILLAWNVSGEVPGQTYYIQTSTDGLNFSDYASEDSDPTKSNATYTFNYPVASGTTGRIFFRLRMVDIHGETSYSSIAAVNLNSSAVAGFSIYPNPPTNYINIALPGDSRAWQIDILAADGSLVQRNAFVNTTTATVVFNKRMAAGTYFLRAVNPLSGDIHSGSFVVAQ